MNTTKMITLEKLQEAHPWGVYSEQHGCYYSMDYDNELGYFIEYTNGQFENDWNWVELDTLDEELREEVELIASHICVNM